MRVVWGSRSLAIIADKKQITILKDDGSSIACEPSNERTTVIALHPSMPYFAAVSSEGEIRVIDARTGKVFRNFKLNSECAGVGLTVQSVLAADAKSGEVIEWNIESTKELRRFVADEAGLSSFCVFNNGVDAETIVAAARTGITVWKDGVRISRFTGHSSSITNMTFLKSGALAALSEHDRSISIWPPGVKKAKHPILQLNAGVPLDWVGSGPRIVDGDSASLLAYSKGESKALLFRVPELKVDATIESLQPASTIRSKEGDSLIACDFGTKEGTLCCLLETKQDLMPELVTANVFSSHEEAGLESIITIQKLSDAKETLVMVDNGKGKSVKRLERSSIVNRDDAQNEKRVRAVSTTSYQEDDRPMGARLLNSQASWRKQQTTHRLVPRKRKFKRLHP